MVHCQTVDYRSRVYLIFNLETGKGGLLKWSCIALLGDRGMKPVSKICFWMLRAKVWLCAAQWGYHLKKWSASLPAYFGMTIFIQTDSHRYYQNTGENLLEHWFSWEMEEPLCPVNLWMSKLSIVEDNWKHWRGVLSLASSNCGCFKPRAHLIKARSILCTSKCASISIPYLKQNSRFNSQIANALSCFLLNPKLPYITLQDRFTKFAVM